MGWIITLLILAGLACLPIGIRGIYRQSGPSLWVMIGPVPIQLYPDSSQRDKGSQKKKSTVPKNASTEKKTGGNLKEFEPLLRTALGFLNDLRRKLRVSRLELHLVMAGDDPCNLAVNYGRAWAAVGNILPLLERVFIIKKRNIGVACDFTSENAKIYVRADISITVGRVLYLLTKYGIRAFKQYNLIKNQRRGGVKL